MSKQSFQLEGNLHSKNGISCKGYEDDKKFLDISIVENIDRSELNLGIEC